MPTLGVALAIPQPWSDRLRRHRHDAGDPRAAAIPPHITILPPTQVDEDTRRAFVDHLAWVSEGAAAFPVLLRGTGTFRPVSPVVFVQVASGIAECERLESAVRAGPVTRELDFHYHPHVTVAHHVDDAALDRAFAALADFEAAFTCSAVHLYEHGADDVWRPVAAFPFGSA